MCMVIPFTDQLVHIQLTKRSILQIQLSLKLENSHSLIIRLSHDQEVHRHYFRIRLIVVDLESLYLIQIHSLRRTQINLIHIGYIWLDLVLQHHIHCLNGQV